MDPNALLAQLRELCKEMPDDALDAIAMLNAFQVGFDSLDGWLSRGGFLPRAWTETSFSTIKSMPGTSSGGRL